MRVFLHAIEMDVMYMNTSHCRADILGTYIACMHVDYLSQSTLQTRPIFCPGATLKLRMRWLRGKLVLQVRTQTTNNMADRGLATLDYLILKLYQIW